jgi:hypothetical protein
VPHANYIGANRGHIKGMLVQYALWVQDLKRNQSMCLFMEIAFEVILTSVELADSIM